MNLKFFVLIPNRLFPAVLLLMGSVFYQIRTLKSELGCWPLLRFPSGVLTPTAHFCGFAFCFLLKLLTEAKCLASPPNFILTKEKKQQINESGSGREHTPQPGDRQHNTPGFAVHFSEVHPCSHVQGEPWIFLHQQRVCKFSYITAYQTECKSNLVSSFLQSILLQICTFQWRWSLSFSRTLNYSNIRHRKSFWQVSYLQRNE